MLEKEPKKIFLNPEGDEFDRKYESLIYSLAKMPKRTDSEKEARIQFVKCNTDFTLFITELFRAVKPVAYDAMLHSLSQPAFSAPGSSSGYTDKPEEKEIYAFRVQNLQETDACYQGDSADTTTSCCYYRVSSKSKKEFDSVAFLEAVYEAIRTYSYEGEIRRYSFRQDIGTIYERKYGDTLYKDTPFSISTQKQRVFRRIAGIVNRSNYDDLSTLELKRKTIEVIGENPSMRKFVSIKGDLDYILAITTGMKTVSLQTNIDESGSKGADLIGNPYAELAYEQILNREQLVSLVKAILVLFQDENCSFGKTKNDDFKIFITHAILRELKTDANGMVYQSMPAGNYEVYEALEGCGNLLMNGIFLEKYLEYLYCKYPCDFKAVYVNLLKGYVVRFEDKLMADCLQISGDRLSKQKKKFYESMASVKKYLNV